MMVYSFMENKQITFNKPKFYIGLKNTNHLANVNNPILTGQLGLTIGKILAELVTSHLKRRAISELDWSPSKPSSGKSWAASPSYSRGDA